MRHWKVALGFFLVGATVALLSAIYRLYLAEPQPTPAQLEEVQQLLEEARGERASADVPHVYTPVGAER